ncbi:MAG TPA: OmpA family protein [Terriglobia bacterium]|nr:OmpA family protein [Terriglobia bacterium]
MIGTKKGPLAGILLVLITLTVSACATKKYVKQQVDPVSGWVDELTEVTKRNENAIKDVDSRAQAGIQTVQTRANEVDQKATAATQKAEEAQQMAQNNQSQISKVETNFNQRIGNIDSYKPVDNASVTFEFNSAELTDEAKAALDGLAGKVKGSKGYVLEIQGFTDKTGTQNYNLALSQRRSESVVRYLSTQHQVPLFRMFILGLGASKEIESNQTRQGRAANRRVEITLLRSEIESLQSVPAEK